MNLSSTISIIKWKVLLGEASYPGNMGAVEMMKFYQIASKKQQRLMDRYIDKGDLKKAWALLQKVTKVKLQNPGLVWSPI